MTQTENYKLNQWERSDRILMEDFNADNAKIEAALGRKLEVVELLDETIEADEAARLDFYFKDVMPWDCTAIFIEIYTPRYDTYHMTVAGSNYYTNEFTTDLASYIGFPFKNPECYITFLPAGGGVDVSRSNTFKYKQLSFLTVTHSSAARKLSGSFRCRVTGII